MAYEIIITRHAAVRENERGITDEQIKTAIVKGRKINNHLHKGCKIAILDIPGKRFPLWVAYVPGNGFVKVTTAYWQDLIHYAHKGKR